MLIMLALSAGNHIIEKEHKVANHGGNTSLYFPFSLSTINI